MDSVAGPTVNDDDNDNDNDKAWALAGLQLRLSSSALSPLEPHTTDE